MDGISLDLVMHKLSLLWLLLCNVVLIGHAVQQTEVCLYKGLSQSLVDKVLIRILTCL